MKRQVAMRYRLGILLFAPLALAGCGEGTAELTGQVRLEGRPLSRGTVTAFTADGRIFPALIDRSGHYQITGLPVGPVRLAVSTHPPIPPSFGLPQQLPPSQDAPRLEGPFGDPAEVVGPANRPDPETGFPSGPSLPEHYNHPEQSGLAYRIPGPGTHVYDLHLRTDEGFSRKDSVERMKDEG
jgi:hypothetical protein